MVAPLGLLSTVEFSMDPRISLVRRFQVAGLADYWRYCQLSVRLTSPRRDLRYRRDPSGLQWAKLVPSEMGWKDSYSQRCIVTYLEYKARISSAPYVFSSSSYHHYHCHHLPFSSSISTLLCLISFWFFFIPFCRNVQVIGMYCDISIGSSFSFGELQVIINFVSQWLFPCFVHYSFIGSQAMFIHSCFICHVSLDIWLVF